MSQIFKFVMKTNHLNFVVELLQNAEEKEKHTQLQSTMMGGEKDKDAVALTTETTNSISGISTKSTPTSTNSSKKKKLKESKSKRKAELRRKNLGLGIGTIDVKASTKSNKKIRFDDDFVPEKDEKIIGEEEEVVTEEDRKEKEQLSSNNFADVNDDDDEIEQVSASVAKNEALQLRAAERETRKAESAITQKRKRKKKIIAEPKADNNDDDELDEEFLAMVDTAREDDARLKKLQQQSKPRLSLGRHTTFVSEENDVSATKPIRVDHNIEVVVLPSEIGNANDDNNDNSSGHQANTASQERSALAISSGLSTEPSNTAILFCRGSHLLQRNNSNSKSKSDDQIPYTRSRRMKYKISRGRPASNFLVKKKRG